MFAKFVLPLQEIDKSDMWIMGNDHLIYHIKEGTGDNLSYQDIDDGYVDYIYLDTYETLSDISEGNTYDGGMILLKKLYKDMTIKEIIKEVEDFYEITLMVE